MNAPARLSAIDRDREIRVQALAEAKRWRDKVFSIRRVLKSIYADQQAATLESLAEWEDHLRVAEEMWAEELFWARDYRKT